MRDAEIYKLFKDSQKTENNATEIKEFATHTLFDLEKHVAVADGNIPLSYQKFLTNMAQNKMIPVRPLETLKGFKKGEFELPDML